MITIATPIYGDLEPPGIIQTGGVVPDFPDNTLITQPNFSAGDLLWIFSSSVNPDVDGTWDKPAIMNFSGAYNVHCKIAAGNSTDNAFTQGLNLPQAFHMFFKCTTPSGAGSWGQLPAASSASVSGNLTTFPIQGLNPIGQTEDRVVTVGFGRRTVANNSGPAFSYPSYVPNQFKGYLLDAILFNDGTTRAYVSTFARVEDGTEPSFSADAWGGASAGLTGATFSRLHKFRFNAP